MPDHEPGRLLHRGYDRLPAGRALPGVESLKIYLSRFREQGAFCEQLAVQIRDEVASALELERSDVSVKLVQKPRGGITITASV